ncbi:MAG: sugar ABC transporter permease [Clostridia bacterium]
MKVKKKKYLVQRATLEAKLQKTNAGNFKKSAAISHKICFIDAQLNRIEKGLPLLRRKLSLRQREAITGWAFVTPVLIGFLVFTAFSMIFSLYISFYDWNMLSDPKFIGTANYVEIFTKDPYFWDYLWNTFYYVIILVPIVLVISLMFAILLNKKVKGFTPFYRACLFLPCVISTVAVSLVWKWILNSNEGTLNELLRAIGIANPPSWMGDKNFAKLSIIFLRIWQMSGYYMIMFLTGLQTIPASLYEASKVDGASKTQQLFHITIPMLRPTTFAITLLLVMEAFNIFEVVLIMTQGRLNTSSLMYYVYELGFQNYRMGYASALGWILFLIIMVFTVIRVVAKKDETM